MISPSATTALVALHRSAEIAVFDVWRRSFTTVISGLYQRPLGIAFTSQVREQLPSVPFGFRRNRFYEAGRLIPENPGPSTGRSGI